MSVYTCVQCVHTFRYIRSSHTHNRKASTRVKNRQIFLLFTRQTLLQYIHRSQNLKKHTMYWYIRNIHSRNLFSKKNHSSYECVNETIDSNTHEQTPKIQSYMQANNEKNHSFKRSQSKKKLRHNKKNYRMRDMIDSYKMGQRSPYSIP